MSEYLMEQGIWEQEIDEFLSNFGEDVTEEDIIIIGIFDTTFDLGINYIDNVVGTLDHHIEAVLDYSALGEQIANSCDEYLLLESGRVIEFEI